MADDQRNISVGEIADYFLRLPGNFAQNACFNIILNRRNTVFGAGELILASLAREKANQRGIVIQGGENHIVGEREFHAFPAGIMPDGHHPRTHDGIDPLIR